MVEFYVIMKIEFEARDQKKNNSCCELCPGTHTFVTRADAPLLIQYSLLCPFLATNNPTYIFFLLFVIHLFIR